MGLLLLLLQCFVFVMTSTETSTEAVTPVEPISGSPSTEYFYLEQTSSLSEELEDGIEAISGSPTDNSSLVSVGVSSLPDDDITGKPTWKWYKFSPVRNWFRCCQLVFGTVGFGGNFVVVLVLFRRRHAKSSTDTLIGALAAADLLTSLLMIPRPYLLASPYLWLSRLYCYVVGTDALLRTCITASVFTLTALSVQRYVAVIYPIRYRITFRRSHTIKYVVALWFLSCAVNAYIVFFAVVDPIKYTCNFRALPATIQISGAILYMVISFLVPVIIMVVTQVTVIRRLRVESALFGTESSRTDESNPAFRLRQTRKKVIHLVLIVIITFIISWTPGQIGLVVTQITTVHGDQLLGKHTYWSFVVIAYINSCANPVIYTIRCPQFRKAAREMFSRSVTSRHCPVFDQIDATNPSSNTLNSTP